MKPFLLLSKQSKALIAHCLQSSESSAPHSLPKLIINRLLAQEHRANPALDPSCRNAIFTQVWPHHTLCQVPVTSAGILPLSHPLSALLLSSCMKGSDLPRTISPWTTGRSSVSYLWGVISPEQGAKGSQVLLVCCWYGGGMCMGLLLSHRWPLTYSQWWECDFITEGIIDNGESSSLVSRVLGCSSVGAHAVPAALGEAAPCSANIDHPCISPSPPVLLLLPQGGEQLGQILWLSVWPWCIRH